MTLLEAGDPELSVSRDPLRSRSRLTEANLTAPGQDIERQRVLNWLDEFGASLADRTTSPGHLTGSALVVDADGERVMVMLHTKLKRWLQPGGHADGDHELAGVALREATEETGVHGLRVLVPAVDLDLHDVDHGDGRTLNEGGALAWLDELLHSEGITDATGEVWLHCYPRVLGYTFKPVSFWYCHAADNSLRAIVVEVNNTFGERHCYLLDRPQYGVEQRANKVFHVSPFCAVQGDYRFRFMRTADHTVARVDHDDANGPLIETSVSGQLKPITRDELRHALWGYPLMLRHAHE